MQATTASPPPRWVPETPEDELAAAFGRAARQLKSLQAADPANVACLGTIMRLGPLRVSALADELGLDISTTSRHVSNLEAEDLLAREPDPDDRRATLLTLTAAGEQYLRQCIERRSRALQTATRSWPSEDLATLTTLMNRLADALCASTDSMENC